MSWIKKASILKLASRKPRTVLSKSRSPSLDGNASDNEDIEDIRRNLAVPRDVKEGHVAVMAVGGEHHRRFIVPLSYLAHPAFLRLLDQAEEEFGLSQGGTLTLPCRPSEIERVLKGKC
ncbi:auxin-induced protein X15-like [Magnolia sinica]|uniref:auxin-induced protein X15-like n=1 Tax=Magnolia sinica TaxID=86752 RepID=UPI00265A764F|nr:auxin-induced protein X15-like [Magnolia sinica]